MAFCSIFVLFLPTNAELLSNIFRGYTLPAIPEGAPQAISDHYADGTLGLCCGWLRGLLQQEGCLTHIFHAPGDHNIGIAGFYRLSSQKY